MQKAGAGKAAGAGASLWENSASPNGLNEFLGNFHKFISQVSHTLHQLTGDVRLVMPTCTITDIERAAEDEEVMAELEHAMSEWSLQLAGVMQREAEKQPVGKGTNRTAPI